jgi:hypothetical protein
MGTGRQIPTSRGLVVVVAALSIALPRSSSSSTSVSNRLAAQRWGWIGAISGHTSGSSFGSLLFLRARHTARNRVPPRWPLGAALDAGDQVSAAAFGFLFVAVAFAVYALFQDGHPGHPLVTAIYGFAPDGLGLHAVAYYGSAALVVLMPLVVLAYALTRGRAQRVSAAAGPLLVLGVWIAIRSLRLSDHADLA